VKHSDSLDKIAPALVAAQKAMGNAVKSSSNPHFRSTYANLGDVWNAAETALADNHLAVTQGVEDADESGFTLVSTLWHTSGQWISEGVRIPLEKPTAQGAGSGITYGRRYGLEALLGIVSEDDDGNAASGKTVTQGERAPAPRPVKPNGQPPKAQVCPKCGGPAWDNRGNKKNPKGPDFTCKDKTCKNDKGFTTGWWEEKDKVTAMAAPHNAGPGMPGFDEQPDFGPDDDWERV
jgi:hypothetical protein